MPSEFRFEVAGGPPFSDEERAELERLIVFVRESTQSEAVRDGLDVGDLLMSTQFDRDDVALRVSMSLPNSSYEAFDLSLDHPNTVVVLFLDRFPSRQSLPWRAWLDEIELVWRSEEEGWDLYRGLQEWGEVGLNAVTTQSDAAEQTQDAVAPMAEDSSISRDVEPFHAELGYSYGYNWSPQQQRVLPGSHKYGYPWTEEYARAVFESDFDHTKALSILRFDTSRRPSAAVMIVPKTRSVNVFFYDEQGREVLRYIFENPGFTALSPEKFFPDPSLVREGQLFLSDVQALSYRENSSHEPLYRDSRQFSSDGRTKLLVYHSDESRPGPPVERVFSWGYDDSFDIVNSDGYWEPFPTEFGDWDRFFVRDRPGGVRSR